MAWYNPMTWGAGQKVKLDPNAGKITDADELRRRMQMGFNAVQNRQAPQAGYTQVGQVATGTAAQVDPRQQAQARAMQAQLAGHLTGVLSGQQAGAGELAVNRQANQAVAQQQAAARMQRGGNAALAGRTAAINTADIGLNAAGQAQQAAVQDQQVAGGQLAGVAGQMREQDIGLAGQNAQLKQQMNVRNLDAQDQRVFQQAGLDQATSLSNMQSRLQTMGMNDQAALQYMSQLFGLSATEMQGRLAQEGLKLGNYDPGWGREFVGQVLQTGGKIAQHYATGGTDAAASDRELKKDVRVVSRQIDQMLDKLKPAAYRYKNEAAHGEGRRAGVMAQDLEGSEAGRRIVREKPDGKYIDVNAGISAALAAVARLNARVRTMEKAKK